MTTAQAQQESLSRAVSGVATTNYLSIIQGFINKSIAPEDIKPRENVFTFNAWKALGRSVRKGEHGVKVCVWVPVQGGSKTTATEGAPESSNAFTMPRNTTVFHVSQTDPIQ